MRKFRMVHETPSHFIMHNGEAHFHIAKEGLHPDMHAKIKELKVEGIEHGAQKMSDGGEIEKKKDNKREPASVDYDFSKQQPQPEVLSDEEKRQRVEKSFKSMGFAEGGEVPTGASRDPKATQQEQEQNAAHLKRELSVPYANYGTNGPTPPQTITYNFYHGAHPPQAQHFDVGGAVLPNREASDQAAYDQPVATPETTPPPPAEEPGFLSKMLPYDVTKLTPEGQSLVDKIKSAVTPYGYYPPESPTTSPEAAAQVAGPTPPPSEQVSFAPPKVSPAASETTTGGQAMPKGDFPTGGLPQFQEGEKLGVQGINALAKAQADASKDTAKVYDDFQKAQAQRAEAFKQENDALEQQQQTLRTDILSQKIDPNRLWHESSTGGKIATILGLIFGGIGSGLTNQPSQAAAMLQSAIRNDIEAQKEDKSGKMTLYKEGLEKYRDKQLAENYAMIRAHTVLEAQIAQAAAKLGTAQADALAKKATGELYREDAPRKMELNMEGARLKLMDEMNRTSSGTAGGTETDPAALSQKIEAYTMNRFLSPEEAKAAKEEVVHYKNLKDDINETRRVFKTLYETSKLANRVGSPVTSSQIYDQQAGPYLEGLTKEKAGRVTPFNAQLFKAILPGSFTTEKAYKDAVEKAVDMVKENYKYPATLVGRKMISANDPALQRRASQEEHNKKYTVGPPVK